MSVIYSNLSGEKITPFVHTDTHNTTHTHTHTHTLMESQKRNPPFTHSSIAISIQTPKSKYSLDQGSLQKLSPPWTATLESSQQKWRLPLKTLPYRKSRQFRGGTNTN